MLVLERKLEEKVVVVMDHKFARWLLQQPEPVVAEIQVVRINATKTAARLGLEFPDLVQLHREEVWEAIQREQVQ